jgi:hypothetical protein
MMTRPGWFVAVAIAALAAPTVLAADPWDNITVFDKTPRHGARYAQKHFEPGPSLPPMPEPPVKSLAMGGPASDAEGASAAVFGGGGRALVRSRQEITRDSIRRTIKRLG